MVHDFSRSGLDLAMIVAVFSLLLFTLEPSRAEGNYLPTFAALALYWTAAPWAAYHALSLLYSPKAKYLHNLHEKLDRATKLSETTGQ